MSEGLESPPSGCFHGPRIAARARRGDRGMRTLERLGDEADSRLIIDIVVEADGPELPVVLIRRIRFPQLQDDVGSLGRHLRGVLGLQTVNFHIRRYAARSEAEIEPPLGKVIQKGQPAGHMGRMVLIETDRSRAHPNPAGLPQGPCDEDLGHHDVLVLHGVMLTDPELAEPEFLGPNDQLQVLVMALGPRLLCGVEGHDENAVINGVHGFAPVGVSKSRRARLRPTVHHDRSRSARAQDAELYRDDDTK